MKDATSSIWKIPRAESRVEDTLSLNPIGLPICSPARPGLESSPYVIRLGAPHGCCRADTKTQTPHATVHVTRVDRKPPAQPATPPPPPPAPPTHPPPP